jgi:ubiquinone/menaquinone biosynthesis C-methylase UbiE
MQSNIPGSEKGAVLRFFTESTAEYGKLFNDRRTGSNFSFRTRLNLAVQMTSATKGRLLDCACGTGEITSRILSSGHFTRATIVDLSPRMLEAARERMTLELKGLAPGDLEFVSSDIFEYAAQTQEGKFDLILCLGLIAHTGRLEELLKALRRLLSPNGNILLQSSLLDHAGTRIVRALTAERYHRRHGYRISYFRHRDILRAASTVSLEAVMVRRFTFGFPLGDRLCAWMNYFLEKSTQHWTKVHGAEALYLLQAVAPSTSGTPRA